MHGFLNTLFFKACKEGVGGVIFWLTLAMFVSAIEFVSPVSKDLFGKNS